MTTKILTRPGKRKRVSSPTLTSAQVKRLRPLHHVLLKPVSPRPMTAKRSHFHLNLADNTRSGIHVQKLEPIIEIPSPYTEYNPSTKPRRDSCASWWSNSTASSQEAVFQYYLPHISNSTSDFYTATDWVAYDMRDIHDQENTKQPIVAQLELPFIHEDDFNYYPTPSDLPYDENIASTEEGLVSGRKLKRTKLVKKKGWEMIWLERKVAKLLSKLKLRK